MLVHQSHRLSRRGYSEEECQDACACRLQGNGNSGCFAIADGATESGDAGLWAQMLTQEFVAQPDPLNWRVWLPALQFQFSEAVRSENSNNAQLPWFLDSRSDLGAYSAFLALVITDDTWQAIAIGDCCVFLVRDDILNLAFPIEHSSWFNNDPALIGSTTTAEQITLRQNQKTGRCQRGDCFWLMTDALAKWFLCEVEAGRKPWEALQEPSVPFAKKVEKWRKSHALHNDDTTLIKIALSG